MALNEVTYVERDFLVEAQTPEEAVQKAKDRDTLDEGEDHCCSVEEVEVCGVAIDHNDKPYEPVLATD